MASDRKRARAAGVSRSVFHSCHRKRPYDNVVVAEERARAVCRLRNSPHYYPYLCPNCGKYHVGGSNGKLIEAMKAIPGWNEVIL